MEKKKIGPNVKGMKKKFKRQEIWREKNQTGSYVEIEKCKWHGACSNYLTPPGWNWFLLLGGKKSDEKILQARSSKLWREIQSQTQKWAWGVGWEVENVGIRLGGELARVPASRVDVPVVIRIHLQGATDFLYCKDVAPGPAVGKWEALVGRTRRGENRFGTPKAGQPWLPQQCSLHSEWTSARPSVVKTKPRKSSCTKEKESGQLGRREPHTSRKLFQKGVCGQ